MKADAVTSGFEVPGSGVGFRVVSSCEIAYNLQKFFCPEIAAVDADLTQVAVKIPDRFPHPLATGANDKMRLPRMILNRCGLYRALQLSIKIEPQLLKIVNYLNLRPFTGFELPLRYYLIGNEGALSRRSGNPLILASPRGPNLAVFQDVERNLVVAASKKSHFPAEFCRTHLDLVSARTWESCTAHNRNPVVGAKMQITGAVGLFAE